MPKIPGLHWGQVQSGCFRPCSILLEFSIAFAHRPGNGRGGSAARHAASKAKGEQPEFDYEANLMRRYPVRRRLNNSKIDDAEAASPVTLDTPTQAKLF